MERSEYRIGHLTYFQEELTYGQDKKLLKFYNSIRNKSFKNEELKLKDLPEILEKYNLLDSFFGILLKPKWNLVYLLSFKWIRYLLYGQIAIDKAKNTEIGEIFNDFFLWNRKYVTILKEYLNTLGLTAIAMEKTAPAEKKE